MKNIDLHTLASELHSTAGVRNADVISRYYPEDTIRVNLDNNAVMLVGIQDGYPQVALCEIRYTPGDKTELPETCWYDFTDDKDYRKGAESIVSIATS